MSITIAGRHFDITAALKSHIDDKFNRLREHFEKDIEADVVLSVERHRHIAEMTMHVNGLHVHGRESTGDMYSSVDDVIHKLEKQVRKYKNRISSAQHRNRKPLHELEHHLLELTESLEAEVETPTAVESSHRVIEREAMEVKPMTVDEAVLQLELRDYDFLVFSNSESGKINVLYQRTGDRYGLIVPPN
jgi:putative sigma-54 modulation protein